MEIVLLAILTFFAAIVGTLTGFGSSTVMIPFVVLFFPLPVALLFVGIIHTFNDIWKIILFKEGINWKLIFAFGIPGIIFSIVGARFIFSFDENILKKILGIFLIIYAIYLIKNPKFKLHANNTTAAIGGSLSGFLAGILGIGGAARGAFLTSFNLKKHVYLFTSGLIALFIDLPRIGTYILSGTKLPNNLLWGLILFVPISFLGAQVAKKIVDKISKEKFRVVIAVFLILIGVRFLSS